MSSASKASPDSNPHNRFFVDLLRSFGGALVFSFPMLMTMEMWRLGFYIGGLRLTLFTLLTIPLLIGLSHFAGFKDTFTGGDTVLEAFMAYVVGFVTASVMLFLFGVITVEMSADEIIGKISLQAVGASLGAMFAQSLLGGGEKMDKHAEARKRKASYAGQLFLTCVGAIFLSLSVSPTEEMALISYQMTGWHTVGLAVLSLVIMHAFIHAIELRGKDKEIPLRTPWWSLFLRFTVVGYAAVLLISFYVLWTFGSVDGVGFSEQVKTAIVLGLPAAVGGGASRLIL